MSRESKVKRFQRISKTWNSINSMKGLTVLGYWIHRLCYAEIINILECSRTSLVCLGLSFIVFLKRKNEENLNFWKFEVETWKPLIFHRWPLGSSRSFDSGVKFSFAAAMALFKNSSRYFTNVLLDFEGFFLFVCFYHTSL